MDKQYFIRMVEVEVVFSACLMLLIITNNIEILSDKSDFFINIIVFQYKNLLPLYFISNNYASIFIIYVSKNFLSYQYKGNIKGTIVLLIHNRLLHFTHVQLITVEHNL